MNRTRSQISVSERYQINTGENQCIDTSGNGKETVTKQSPNSGIVSLLRKQHQNGISF